ncbi:hypothetical protein [Aquamicrobium sp. LC103]|uniref:FitA-like ribbon-helix-helix domain-containing protein n=1 Tax=Aquamicrobium sp. LC103 TaxID=1120658 RepID=UPI00063E9881|nr:hypothetical protein [Aquamicrobium sp. LC103]TKT75348.1 toxin-antitoxin system [Aquamicrobium sp. LC103]
MAQLLVRQIDDDIKQRLQERAAKHGTSMEEEVRSILRAAVLQDEGELKGLGTEIASIFRGIGVEGEPLERLPKSSVRAEKFDE